MMPFPSQYLQMPVPSHVGHGTVSSGTCPRICQRVAHGRRVERDELERSKSPSQL